MVAICNICSFNEKCSLPNMKEQNSLNKKSEAALFCGQHILTILKQDQLQTTLVLCLQNLISKYSICF